MKRISANYIAQPVTHPRIGRQSVAAGAAGFLVVAFETFRQIHVCDESHVGLVDTHAERDGRDDHHAVLAQEASLVRGARASVHAGVIRQRVDTLLPQPLCGLLDFLARQAVDDAGFAGVTGEKVGKLKP